ncbi:izumo sperm-egg fusion protein 1-like isoform X2 [Marmota flaviventris]|uniref:izumo sperm-egg fusion protein 1-like isoform X2 n=1 Tax=Marmota flaviventris TaxID=93162 RepID=UPI003A88E2C9
MGLCFALPLAALASCLLPADCCVICDQAVLTALKSLKENYLPEHLDIKSHKTVMERAEQIIVEFKDLPMKDGSFWGAIDNSTLEKASQSVVKELKRITDSNVKGDQFVKQLYQMLEKEKGKFAQYAAQFQKKDYCPNKCGVMMQRLLWCPDCNLGVYICWKSLDCGQRLVKIHEKENLTLNCLFEWHPLSVGLTDYQFYRITEDGSEKLLYKGKNPMLTIPSVNPDNSGSYRCELGSVSSGPATIIHFLVTVLPQNSTEETSTTDLETGGETASEFQSETAPLQVETAPLQAEKSSSVQGGTGTTVQATMGPTVQGETASLQGEPGTTVQSMTGPTVQGEMASFQGESGTTFDSMKGPTVQGETAPLQGEMGTTVQSETSSPVQGETVQGEVAPSGLDEMAPLPSETGSPVQGEMTPFQGETAPGEGETAPGEGEAAPGEGEEAPGEGEAAPGEGETAPGEGETAPGEHVTAPPGQNVTASLQDVIAPVPGETAQGLESSSETSQPSHAKSMLQGPLFGLLICSSIALIAALGVRRLY